MVNEQIGISTVVSALSITDHLVPCLQSGDKGVSYDGHVDVYKTASPNHRKGDLDGQVLVQVKGHKARLPFRNTISFSVEVEHLQNYLNSGGVMFFVVYFDNDGENRTIYYDRLLPYDLKRYLKEAGNNKKKAIPLKRFPTEKKAITEVFVNFLVDMRKQRASIDAENMTLETLTQSGGLKSLSFSYTSFGEKQDDVLDLLLKKEMFLYADLNCGIKYPVEHITNVVMACASVTRSVFVGNKKYYSGFVFTKNADGTQEKSIGRSCVIKTNPETGDEKITFTPSGKLTERIRDFEFIIAAIEAGGFDIEAGGHYSITEQDVDVQKEKYHNALVYLKKAKQALDRLGVKGDLDIDAMQDKDRKDIALIIMSVVDGKDVEFNDNKYSCGIFSVANLKILVSIVKDAATGRMRIYNFFDSPMEWYVVNKDGIRIDAPCFILVNRDDIASCCNITTENIMLELDKWKDFTPFSGYMTTFLLEILQAFDSNPEKRWLLELADTIEDAIEERDESVTPEVDRLNKLQIAKRQRSLNVGEQMELMHIIQNSSENLEFQIGAHILLGQIDIAKELITRLSKEQKEAFENYPIYNLVKNCN